jgi:hypothetical protein
VARAAEVAGKDHDLLCEDCNRTLEALNEALEALENE